VEQEEAKLLAKGGAKLINPEEVLLKYENCTQLSGVSE
jgi:hypothetical protein